LKPKIWDDVMAINLTANYRLIRSLDPLLRRSEAGRVLFVSSAVAQLHRPYWGGYAVSKAGLEMLALTYAEECRATSVKVNVLNPGPTRTKMRAQAMPGEDPETLPAPDDVTPMIVDLLSPTQTRSGEVLSFRR
jgi:NAD(P)-dependent dehydrogenase (short-subunit alcohol dehydrogenase family)